jgi:Large polyvalent protein-associated domain 7
MATAGGGGGSSWGTSSAGAGASGTASAPSAQTSTASNAPNKIRDVEVLGADGKSQGVFNDGKPVAPNIRLEALDSEGAQASGARLESYGKGATSADLDLRTNQVILRRSGRVVDRFENTAAIVEFAERKKLAEPDREILLKLDAVRALDPQARANARRLHSESATVRDEELINVLTAEAEKGRIRAEVERNDAEVFARVEAMRKARRQRLVEPVDPIPPPIAAERAAQAAEARSDDTIQRESPFASPNAKIRVIPADIRARYIQSGEKFYHSNDSKAVAFVDRGDKLETPSSAPQIARSLVAIAEARGWDELRVIGTDGFRKEVWLEASSRGIHVDGYKPSELDKAELERRNPFTRDHNAIEKRSEILRKVPPEQGVRRDPSLAGHYAVIRRAELLAEKQVHPDSRADFMNSVHDLAADKDRIRAKVRVADGKLVEHGAANYNFDKDEQPSYYVKLRNAQGRELVQWGVGLRSAMQVAAAKPGDTMQLRVTQSKGVVVEGNVRDSEGRIIGRKTVDAHRNEWEAVVLAREQAPERQVEQQRVR